MAEPLKHRVSALPRDTAAEELELLLETLHRSGTLRTLIGLCGSVSGISKVVLQEVDSAGGRRMTGNLSLMATTLTTLDPAALEPLVQGLVKGVNRTADDTNDEPPGVLRLLGRLQSTDVRRGLSALINVLQGVGAELRQEAPDHEEEEPHQLRA